MRIQADEHELADIDPTPEELDAWRASLPPNVLAEMDAESGSANAEMLQKFEAHAKEYEKANP